MFLLKLFSFFQKTPAAGVFLCNNLFAILKDSLRTVGGDKDDMKNFSKIRRNTKLQNQFSKVFSNAYLHSVSAARARDAQIILRRGCNNRADFIFYSIVVGFMLSTFVIVFFKHKLSSDGLAFCSAIAGVSAGCLRDIFGFEFGVRPFEMKSREYALDESDKSDFRSSEGLVDTLES